MEDDRKTKKQLIDELSEIRLRVAKLKGFEDEIKETRVNHEKFTKAFLQNSIPVGITTLKEGRFVDVSDAFLRLMGRKRDEVVGHTSTESGFITEEQRVIFINELNKYGRVENLEMKVRTKDGALRYGLFNAVMMSLEKEKYLLTVMTDITNRKQAEKKLRESDGKLNAMLQSIPDHMSVMDNELNIIWANETATRMFGNDIIGRKCYEAYHGRKEPCEPYPCITLKAFKDGGVHEHNTDVIDKEGRTIYFQCTANVAVRDGEDKPITVLEISRDITESKRAEEALRVSEENFRRSMDDSPLGIRIVTIEGDTIYVNQAILDIHGYESIEDLISTPVKKRYTPESYAEFKIRREKRKRGDYGPSEYEISIVRKDGEVRYLQVFRKRVLWGGERHFQVIYQDITERKRTEKTLRLITDNMSDMIRVTDLQGVNLYSSPSHFNVLGYKPEERVGKSVFEIVHPDDLEHLIKVFTEGLINKKPGKVEYRIKHAEGHYVWLETMADGIMDDHGEVTAVIMSSRDITKRKQAEEEIRQSNMLLNAIIENIPNTIFLKDAKELRFVLLNRAGEDLTGYSSDDLLGKNDYDFVSKEQADFFTKKDREVLRGKDVVDIPEEPLQTRTKEVRTLHTKKVPILNAHGKPEYLLGISEDISERKRMEEALVKSQEKFRLITENMVDCVALVDTSGTYQYVTPSYSKILGYDPKDMIGITGFSILHPDDLERVLKICMEGIDQGVCEVNYETRLRHRDGHYVHMELRARSLKNAQGEIVGGVLAARDITQRQQLEKERRLAEENFRRSLDECPLGICVVTAEGEIIYVNRAILDIYSFEDLKTTPVKNLYTPESFAEYETRREKRKRGDYAPSEYEVSIVGKDGDIRNLHVFRKEISWDGERQFQVIYQDITDRKHAESDKGKQEVQNRQLQKSESLGRMAASIAHTFNNQLGAVIGNLEMAIDDLPKGSGLFNSLTAAMQAAQKSAEVSGMMLTYLGQSFDNRKVLDLAEVCRRNLPILKATLPGNAALETSFPSPGPVIMASESQLHQVLMILITNAWEAMGKGGGSIHLRVKTVSSADITDGNRYPIDWQPQDSAYACMEVTDAGCGIADDDIEKLFDPFFSSKFTGRGLGLPVALGIVKAHDGVITIESQSGRGSTFRVFLPVSAQEEIREPNKMIEAPAMNGGGIILLVEDEEMVRNMAAAMLKRLGFSVLEAKDGVEAVEIFRQRQDEIRLVLSDLTMPRMDGWETLTALRKLAPGIPVILASGYDKARVMAGDHPELPQIFLSKPYKLNGLRDAISQAIGQQQGKR